jgi:hypothetical protein
MPGAEPSVVLCWEGDPTYIPPLRLSPRQLTVGVRYPRAANAAASLEVPDVLVAPGRYDLADTLRKAGGAGRPDLVVVWSSALRANLPVNLGAIRCPKLLICGDTHHMQRPIGFLLDYARSEPYDAVASAYDRQHLHWFLAAGFENCAWLPGITVQHVPMPWHAQRDDQVVFVGQTGAMHAWRQTLLDSIAAAGVPLLAGQATRPQAAALFSQSLVSFNGSLNGDLNMRVFEVLSAGGFLLTDRLSPQAGFELLLRPGVDCETYRDAPELLDKIAFYRRSPTAALRIAEQGAATSARASGLRSDRIVASMAARRRAARLVQPAPRSARGGKSCGCGPDCAAYRNLRDGAGKPADARDIGAGVAGVAGGWDHGSGRSCSDAGIGNRAEPRSACGLDRSQHVRAGRHRGDRPGDGAGLGHCADHDHGCRGRTVAASRAACGVCRLRGPVNRAIFWTLGISIGTGR